MSSKAKIKGYNAEVYVRDKLIEAGIPCERVPLSGLLGGEYDGDLVIPEVKKTEFVCEVKARKSGEGFAVLERWMKDKAIMFLKRDRQLPMVVLDWDTFVLLMRHHFEAKKN